VRESLEGLIRIGGFARGDLCAGEGVPARGANDGARLSCADVKLPGLSGIDLQQELAKANLQIPIIFLTGHGDIPMSCERFESPAPSSS